MGEINGCYIKESRRAIHPYGASEIWLAMIALADPIQMNSTPRLTTRRSLSSGSDEWRAFDYDFL